MAVQNSVTSVTGRVVLNKVQQEAVVYDDGPQLVFAGAGTGKTRVLTAKIAFIIQDKNVYPNHIFAATFTNKAAREMQNRVQSITGIPCAGLWIGTFHSLCARILRREATRLGYIPAFSIYDADDQLSLVKKTAKELGLDERTMPPRTLLHAISKYKNACLSPDELEQRQGSFFEQELVRVYKGYQKKLMQNQAMDFDDLITNCVYLFRKHPDVLAAYNKLFKYVLVDEYQDTNRSQFYLVKLLAEAHGNIFVVGDDDQSIYGWRGAELANILSFEKVFPGTKTFKLEQNYRSVPAILNFANAAIAPNSYRAPKQLWSGRKDSHPVLVVRYRDDRQEADTVGDRIQQRINNGTKAGDIAVLYRTNAQSRLFEESLRKRKVPYVLVGGTGFYERREIKDCLAYLRLLANPMDDVSCNRILNVPARGLGEKARETLATAARTAGRSMLQVVLDSTTDYGMGRGNKGVEELRTIFSLLIDMNNDKEPPHEILRQMLTLTGYMDLLEEEDSEDAQNRSENISELMNALASWSEDNPDKDLAAFLEEISLASDVDTWHKKDEMVNLMTLHCAKGLEFKAIYFVGCEDGILPSRQNFDDESKIEEERRLFYVGITRAMDALEVSWVDQRWRFGSVIVMPQSRFVAPIAPELYQYSDMSVVVDAREVFRAQSRRQEQKNIRTTREPEHDDFSQETVQYRVGQHVMHKLYGRGEILNLSGFGVDMRMTVLFSDGARRKMMARFADFDQHN
jgi:DNA helicase II / ATP-dependent DNA helicase PcrA